MGATNENSDFDLRVQRVKLLGSPFGSTFLFFSSMKVFKGNDLTGPPPPFLCNTPAVVLVYQARSPLKGFYIFILMLVFLFRCLCKEKVRVKGEL